MDGLRPADPATGDHVETDVTVSSEEILELPKLLKDGKGPPCSLPPARLFCEGIHQVPDGRSLPKLLEKTKAVAPPKTGEATRGAVIVPADMPHRWN